MPLPKKTRVGPYVIIEFLNSGGMADVYRARVASRRQEVALKISQLDRSEPILNNALRFEVNLMSRLTHPGIVRVLPIPFKNRKQQPFMARALNLPGKPWYFAMEYLPGGSLETLTKKAGPLPFDLACAIGLEIAHALSYLHKNNIVHLDIKPDNILFRHTPQRDNPIAPVLTDFGIAAMNATNASMRGGTTVIMPPELIRKMRGELPPEHEIDLRKVDVYMLGVVLYRMWTGKYPFDGLTRKRITSAIIRGRIISPRVYNDQVPPEAEELIFDWLSRDPIMRPDLPEIRRYLTRWAGGLRRFPHTLTPTRRWPFGRKK